MDKEKKEILILGAGAVGLSIAGRLSGICNVSVVCRERHAEVIRKKGLFMDGIWGNKKVSGIKCFSSPEILAEAKTGYDFVLITCKSNDTLNVCNEYSKFLKENIAVSIQNGIGNGDIIQRFSDLVIGATITTNFYSHDNGCVTVRNETEPLKIGIYPGNRNTGDSQGALNEIEEILCRAKISTEISSDIRVSIWEKNLLNIAVNPVSAILSIKVGEVMNENVKVVVTGLIKETFEIMSAEKIKTKWKNPDDYLNYLFSTLVPSFSGVYTSMYQDLEMKRETEIDYINGAVVSLGEKNGIKTPFNVCVCSLLKYCENRKLLSLCTVE
ncbi:2-dehydropantoate 2-reductase [Methanomicrobium sp. W14]|uniref:ketopantoate reductase family protein n=1 Tax=Methanomicrobium sp. W14 TaxID=2817839 RepID=UPI001AE25377|nr:ketopantoate reductase family protein [Methanomicrobium sp. W14]MBP2132668.1 2-dehydropantoate 2-reductase [Methanomicrobium sp. W14]